MSRNTSINWPPVVCLTVKPVGEPDAGDRHVRFDERGWETERCRMAQATAPILDSTFCDITRRSNYVCLGGQSGRAADNVEGPSLPSRPGEFHPEPLTEPDLILSHHPARAIARRLPPLTRSKMRWPAPFAPR